MARRSNIDWEKIEREYRIGAMTIGEISAANGVADSSIRLKAKQKAWSRDMTETVRAATKAAIIADSKARAEQMGADIGREIGEKSAAGMEEAVASQVTENLVVVRKHISASFRSQELVDMMKAELLDQTENKGDYVALGELLDESGPDERGTWRVDKRKEAFDKATSLPMRIDSLKKLVETESKIKDNQRQALNIDGDDRGKGGVEERLRKLAELGA